MTTRFLRKFFKTAFIGIVVDDDKCEICTKTYKGSKELTSVSKSFQLQNNAFPTTLTASIEQTYKDNPYVYTSTLLTTINQGAISECSKEAYTKFQVETRNVQSLCINGKWAVYTSKTDIDSIENKYDKLGGIDFVFSPIVILERFFAKELSQNSVIMTALKLKSIVCVAVFDNKKLLYSSFMSIKSPEHAGPAEETKAGGIEDFFDEDGVHELNDNSMVDLDDLSIELDEEAMQPLSDNIEDEGMKNQKPSLPVSLEDAGNNLKLADFIKDSFNEFYKNPVYESAFIDKVYIADPYENSNDTKLILENELLLSVQIIEINIGEILCNFAIEEAK